MATPSMEDVLEGCLNKDNGIRRAAEAYYLDQLNQPAQLPHVRGVGACVTRLKAPQLGLGVPTVGA